MLSPTKEGALNDFLSSYPTIIVKATTISAIKIIVIYNGMMDDKIYTTPTTKIILNICKTKKYMLSAKYAVECNFKTLYKEQINVGILTDEHLSTYNFFKRDTKYNITELSNHSKTESW